MIIENAILSGPLTFSTGTFRAQAGSVGLTNQQKAALVGYVSSIIDARNASDKANDAAEKEADALNKKVDAERDALGTINDKLTEQRAKLLAAQNSTDPSKSAQIAKIESDISATLSDQIAKRKELAAITAAQAKVAEAAYPEATAARNAAQQALDDDRLDPNANLTSAQEEARAARRRDLQSTITQSQAQIDGKAPPAQPGTPHDLADPDSDYSTPPVDRDDTGTRIDPPDYSTPPSDRDDSGERINDAADAVQQGGTDQTAAATALSTAGQSVQTAAAQSTAAATNLDAQAGALGTALGTLTTSQSGYHDAVMTGLDGTSKNVDALTQAMLTQNQTIANQAAAITQLQRQVGNLSSDDA